MCIVTGMSGMTSQFGLGLCSSLLLPLRSSSVSETSLSRPLSLSHSLPKLSVCFALFLATLPSPGPLENVIRGQASRCRRRSGTMSE